MSTVRVLHMADMHLQWPFAGMGADGAQGRLRREELKATFAAIIDLASSESTDLLLIAGDLFEHAHMTRGAVQFVDEQFRRIGRTRVFISPGNHDPHLPASYYQTYPWAPNVHIFGPQAQRVDLTVAGVPVSVHGWGFGAWEVRESHVAGLGAQEHSRLNLVVVHGGEEAYHPFAPADLAALGADYIALGHIHKEGVLLQQGGRVIARYSGSPEPLGFGEPGEHGVYVGEVGKGISRMRFVPTARRQYHSLTCDVTGAISLEDLAASICQIESADRRQRHCYRITLEGAVAADLQVDLPLLQEMLKAEFFFVRLLDRTGPDDDLVTLAGERSARGLFVRRLQTMEVEAAHDPAQLRLIRQALAAGLAAFGCERGGAR